MSTPPLSGGTTNEHVKTFSSQDPYPIVSILIVVLCTDILNTDTSLPETVTTLSPSSLISSSRTGL